MVNLLNSHKDINQLKNIFEQFLFKCIRYPTQVIMNFNEYSNKQRFFKANYKTWRL